MVSYAIFYVSCGLICLSGLAAYVFLISCVLPKIFIRPSADNSIPRSRGVRKYKFEDGRALVYEPSLKVNKYFNQYILSKNRDEKFLKCKIDYRVSSVRYTVIALSANGKIIDIIDVEEIIKNRGYTRAVILPTDTAYINIFINEINNIEVKDRERVSFSALRLGAFILCSALMTAVLSAVMLSATRYLWDVLIRLPFLYREPKAFISFILGLAMGGLLGLIVCRSHISRRNTRIVFPNLKSILKLIKKKA